MQEPLGEQEEGGGAGDGDGGAGMESDGELDHCTDDEVELIRSIVHCFIRLI